MAFLLNDNAVEALPALDCGDAAYCLKLEKRFADMGISGAQAEAALCALIEKCPLEALYQAV